VSSRDTLRTLVAVSRSKPTERELCCPECDSDVEIDVELEAGVYLCRTCLSEWATLSDLAVRVVPRG
jgi:ribosomal protein L37AE/L43A